MIDKSRFIAAVQADQRLKVLPVAAETLRLFIDEWERRRLQDRRWLAYMMATTLGECGRGMQPIEENMNYSANRLREVWPTRFTSDELAAQYAHQPEKLGSFVYADRLGNGSPDSGDGWRYRGRGFVQLTGKDNYKKVADLAKIDLVRFPEKAKEPVIAVQALFEGMLHGFYTGKKLHDFFPAGRPPDWKNARKIINGLNRATEFGRYGVAFLERIEGALPAGEDPTPVELPIPAIRPPPAPMPAGRSPGLLAYFMMKLRAFLKWRQPT
jgi:putative chitinase